MADGFKYIIHSLKNAQIISSNPNFVNTLSLIDRYGKKRFGL